MSYRGEDNYTNAYDYIINQLFVRDYNDEDDYKIIKMKLSCLDGPISNEEAGGSRLEAFKHYFPNQKVVVTTSSGDVRIYKCLRECYSCVDNFDFMGYINEWKPYHTYHGPETKTEIFYNAGTWDTYNHTTFGDIIKIYDGEYKLYRCTTTFTSGIDFSLDSGSMTRIYYTDWKPNTYYAYNSYVEYSNMLWKANTSHTSGNSFVVYPITSKNWSDVGQAGVRETSINSPVDHWNSLLNELTMLDIYVKTSCGSLKDNENTFTEEKEERERKLENWLEGTNKITGVPNQAFDYPYYKRPPLTTDEQFNILKSIFLIAKMDEYKKITDIVYKATLSCIDEEAVNAENRMIGYQLPDDIEIAAFSNAEEKNQENDRYYVNKMGIYRDEIFEIVQYFWNDIGEEYSPSVTYNKGDVVKYSGGKYASTTTQCGVPPGGATWISLENYDNTYLINFCQSRPVVTSDIDTHSGMISAGEGFRYSLIKLSDGTVEDESVFDLSTLTQEQIEALELNYDLPEWGFGPFSQPFDSVGFKYVVLVEGELFAAGGYNDLTGEGEEPDDRTKARFDILDERWKNVNRLREDEINSVGTRCIVESLYSLTAPDLKECFGDHYNDKKEEKRYTIDTLKEICEEFE